MPKKQSDGRYRAKITLGHAADGKVITKYVSGKTKRELEDAKSEARAYYVDGGERREDMLFFEYAKAWYTAKKEPFIGAASRESYLVHLNKHIMPAFGDRMLRAIQPMELQAWVNGYTGKSKTTITMIISIIKSVFKSAYAEGIIQRDPSISLIRPKPKTASERRAFSEEECKRIEEAIRVNEFGAFLAVLYYLGLRRGEALGLRWGDFDWKRKIVHIQRDIDYAVNSSGAEGTLKTPAANREVPVPEPLATALQGVRGLPHVYLFGTDANMPVPRTTFQRKWMLLMVDAGFAKPVEKTEGESEEAKRADPRFDWSCEITPHYFRHNYATMLYYAGVDSIVAMKLLGHSSYAVTAKIYTHLNNMHVEKARDQINKKLLGEKVAEKLPEQF